MVDKKDIGIFSAMNQERATPILRKILANSGISQKNLKDEVQLNQRTVVRHTTELENAGLIESIQDGKFMRYYPTKLLTKMNDDYRKRTSKFRKHLLNMLKKDGVNPKVVRSTDRALHVKITAGESKSVLELATQPFAFEFTLLSRNYRKCYLKNPLRTIRTLRQAWARNMYTEHYYQ